MTTTNKTGRIIWVCNAAIDREMIDALHPVVKDCVLNNKTLPEDYADIFSLEIVEVDGLPRGILDFA